MNHTERYGKHVTGKDSSSYRSSERYWKSNALAFAKEGCNIVLNYHSSLDDETVQEIEECGVTCMPVQGDVSDFAFAADMMKKSKRSLILWTYWSTMPVLLKICY